MPSFILNDQLTDSSRINQDERLFDCPAREAIRCRAHKNIQAFKVDIRAWVKDWNEQLKPFMWTKTAEKCWTHSAASGHGAPAQDRWNRQSARW